MFKLELTAKQASEKLRRTKRESFRAERAEKMN
jgi:hypothetical protein